MKIKAKKMWDKNWLQLVNLTRLGCVKPRPLAAMFLWLFVLVMYVEGHLACLVTISF